MVHDGVNLWATFRYALSYPDESRLEGFRPLLAGVPPTLEELRVLYVRLFEAGAPHPACPLLESFYVPGRPPGDIVLENKLFYKHFGLSIQSNAAPDHLLTQLEFLAWLDYCAASGNEGVEALAAARADYIQRHLAHLPAAARRARAAGGDCYAQILDSLCEAAAGRA
ncbi:MAG: molecular chaperone TorD family protein [Bryobacteraceae bacterium]|nr:molecular chaperone TorD family protein [Bryobacteraceae bacterium]